MTDLYNKYIEMINRQLTIYCPGTGGVLAESMAYSLHAGGKRIRPVLTLAFCQACGGDIQKALPFACALEMIHTYSLIYDDLPCMDNDDLRRGKPTCHVVYGEALALMAGAGLNAEAFAISSDPSLDLPDRLKREALAVLSGASGKDGIVGGQVLDLENDGTAKLSETEVAMIHHKKTGAMLKAAALLGCIAADAPEEKRTMACCFAEKIGLAFQIRDDILDVVGDSGILGKTTGKDKVEKKTTFVDLLGIDKAQRLVEEYTAEAKQALACFSHPEFLVYMADMLCARQQ